MMRFTLLPEPHWLVLGGFITVALLIASYASARGRTQRWVRGLCAFLRLLAIVGLVVCLLDPQWIEKTIHPRRARLAVLLDTSRSMATADVAGGRLGAAQAWIERHLRSTLPDSIDLLRLRFSDTVAMETNSAPSRAEGPSSAIAKALDSLTHLPTGEPVTGVLLVSDGIETGGLDPADSARRLRRHGLRVHTLLSGTTNELQDVRITGLEVRRAVAENAPTRVTVAVRSPGFAGKTVTVQVRKDGQILAAKPLALDGQSQHLDLEFTPRLRGFQIYEVSVSASAGEWLASNNQRPFGLEVVDPTLRVLYMEGTPQNNQSPQPEWKYLKDALQSDPGIKVTTLYRQFGNNGQYLNTVDADPETGERIYPVEHPTHGFPRTLSGLLDYDVVIHSDIRRDSFTPLQVTNMARLVEEFGGGFLMIGGNSAFGRGGYHQTLLDRIIPVAMEGAFDSSKEDFQPKVPRAAWTHPIVAIGADPEETRKIWTDKFPTLHGINRMERAKPGAQVLAYADNAPQGFDGDVLLAVQEVGRGRTMAFTSDTTRSWGADFETLWGEPRNPKWPVTEDNCDNRYYRRFWVNAIRWLAAGRSSRTNPPVVLDLSNAYITPGATASASIQVRDQTQREVTDAEVTLFAGSGTSSNAVGVARFDPTRRAYVAPVSLQRAGTFVISAVARRGEEWLGVDRQLLVAESVDPEMADLQARPTVMDAIARAGEGLAHRVEDTPASGLESLWKDLPAPTVEFHRKPLWDRPVFLAILLGLLVLEWSLRRWKGLA